MQCHVHAKDSVLLCCGLFVLRANATARHELWCGMTIDSTAILDPEQVEKMASAVRRLLGPTLLAQLPNAALDLENGIRFRAVAASCRQERERRGLTLKQMAVQVKLPQYRIKAVEEGSLTSIRSSALKKQISFLELQSWYDRWAAANPTLARSFDE